MVRRAAELIPAVIPPAKGPEPQELREFLDRHSYTQAYAAQLFGTTLRSMQRWCSDWRGQPAPPAFYTFMILVDKVFDAIDPPPPHPPTRQELRDFLERHRLSQTCLAKAAGVNPRAVRAWLSEINPPTPPRWLWHIMTAIRLSQESPTVFDSDEWLKIIMRPGLGAGFRFGGFGAFRKRLRAGDVKPLPGGFSSLPPPDYEDDESDREWQELQKAATIRRFRRTPAPRHAVTFPVELDSLVIAKIGWTHREAARRAGVHYSRYQRWLHYHESNKYPPPCELMDWLRNIESAIDKVGACPELPLHRTSQSSTTREATEKLNPVAGLADRIGWSFRVIARKTKQISVVTLLRWSNNPEGGKYPPPRELVDWLIDIAGAIEQAGPCPPLPTMRKRNISQHS